MDTSNADKFTESSGDIWLVMCATGKIKTWFASRYLPYIQVDQKGLLFHVCE